MLCSANSALVPARILKRNALKMLKQILPEQVCLQVFSLRKQGGPENPKDKSVCTLISNQSKVHAVCRIRVLMYFGCMVALETVKAQRSVIP